MREELPFSRSAAYCLEESDTLASTAGESEEHSYVVVAAEPEHSDPKPVLQIELPLAILEQLLSGNKLYAADFRCLNTDSKKLVSRYLLSSCCRISSPIRAI